jgi:hypothetical protein
VNIVLYTIGFISLLSAIVVLLLSLVGKGVPRPEPEFLVVDAPLPGQTDPEEGPIAESQWAR